MPTSEHEVFVNDYRRLYAFKIKR